MEMSPEVMGYDRAIVVFSPDGRLFQVEYAREAVKKGTTAVGITFKDGVVFATLRKSSNVVVGGEKITKVDDHLAVASAGLVADARVLIDMARVKAQQNRLLYDEPISVRAMAKFIADRQQLYTQYAGVRPYGVSLLVGGFDTEPGLFETDPSGIMIEAKARAIGKNSEKINEYFEKKYKENMNLKKASQMCVDVLKEFGGKEQELNKDTFLLVVVNENGFRKISKEEYDDLGIKL